MICDARRTTGAAKILSGNVIVNVASVREDGVTLVPGKLELPRRAALLCPRGVRPFCIGKCRTVTRLGSTAPARRQPAASLASAFPRPRLASTGPRATFVRAARVQVGIHVVEIFARFDRVAASPLLFRLLAARVAILVSLSRLRSLHLLDRLQNHLHLFLLSGLRFVSEADIIVDGVHSDNQAGLVWEA